MPSTKAKNCVEYHEINRSRICLLCLKKKNKFFEISGKLYENIEKIIVNYNLIKDYFPNVVCATCKARVFNSNKIGNKNFKHPDYSKFKVFEKNTRSKDKKILCECDICKLIRSPGHKNFGENIFSLPDKTGDQNSQKFKICEKCNTEFILNEVYDCPFSVNNLTQNVENTLSLKEQEHLICNLIKNVVNEKEQVKESCIKNKNISLSQVRGKPLRISVNLNIAKKCSESKLISEEDVLKIESNLGLSRTVTLNIASNFRKMNKDRKTFEPNLKEKLKFLSSTLNSYFDVQTFEVSNIQKGVKVSSSEETLVFCKDVEGLIDFLQKKGNMAECI